MLDQNNWCVIYIWRSTGPDGKFCSSSDAISCNGNVGHVSLRTKETYASFWPAKGITSKEAALGTHATFVETFEEDCHNEENRKPHTTVVLYSLDINKINTGFQDFKISRAAERWSLFGKSLVSWFNKGRGQSCSGLVYALLDIGEIFTRLDYNSDWERDCLHTSPNSILHLLSTAKYSELEKHPETKYFNTPVASDLEQLIPRDALRNRAVAACSIM